MKNIYYSPIYVSLQNLLHVNFIEYIIILTFFAGCNELTNVPIDDSEPLAEDLALYVSIDGGNNNAALWVLNANNFKFINKLETGQGVPFTIEFSPDYLFWYSVWKEYPSRINYLQCVDSRSMTVVRKTAISFPQSIVADNNSKYLITYPYKPIEFYDRQTLTLIKQDTSLEMAWQIKPLLSQNKLYIALKKNGSFAGIAQYDIDNFSVEKIIPVADSVRQINMQPADLVISPDENYAFLSVFNWIGGGGYNSFFVLDIPESKVVGEHNCGAFAQLSVDSEGKYVYLSDPAGYLYQMDRTNQILRFDVNTHTMSVFMNFNDLGLNGSSFISDKIAIAPNNSLIFISVDGDIRNINDKSVQILKIDSQKRKVLNTFSLPVNSNGNVTQRIINLKIKTYPK